MRLHLCPSVFICGRFEFRPGLFGRVSVPLAWFPKLLQARPEQRGNWKLIGKGIGIHWPAIDEDVSVASVLLAK